MKTYMTTVSAIALAAVPTTATIAQEQTSAERDRDDNIIIVTATKRAENIQDIPIAIQAIGGDQLTELNVENFSDYLQQLPGVSAGGSGPGQNTIYIRGLASTTPNLTTAGVAGLAPNVALYLDEQPLSQPGRNLDVYAVDLERIEVLAGPQGTLFGASAQAGAIRLITNKPKIGELEAVLNVGGSLTKGGDASGKVEAVLNVPMGESFALRGVFFYDKQGGYIDNVAGTRDLRASARFRREGTVRANGVPVSSNRAGFQATSDLSEVTFNELNNQSLVEDNFNDTRYWGFRIGARYEMDDWSVTIAYAKQSIDSDGVFFTDPELEDYAIQRFHDDSISDDYDNISWTLEGVAGPLDIVYTGAFTDRRTDQMVDYTDYLFIGQYLPYYICDGSVTYPGDAAPSGTCQAPYLFVDSRTRTRVQTHELRFNTPAENRLRATVGGFYSDLTLTERNDFTYPNSVNADTFGSLGFAENFPFMSGYTSDPGPFPAGVIFRNDVRRTDRQFGIFGEVNFDLVPDRLTVTFGGRYYNIAVGFEGSANSSFCNSGSSDANAFGTDISDLYNGDGEYTFRGTCATARHITYRQGQSLAEIRMADPALSDAQAMQIFNALAAPDKARTNGFIFKANVSWKASEDVLVYATFSQGFRPGLLNRPGGAAGPNGFVVPFVVDTDSVNNYEIGWKLSLLDRQLQFNGNGFYVDINRLQTTIFDPSITNLFFSDNAANARILGIEADFSYTPDDVPGLTIAGAFSILDTKITDVLTPTGDVVAGGDLAFAPSFQGNLRVRYEFPLGNGDWTMHAMPQLAYSSKSRSDIIEINAGEVAGYTTLSFALGASSDRWSAEVYAENLTNNYGEVANNFVNDRERVTVVRPRTIGLRFGFRY